MEILRVILTILEGICCAMLIGVILIQKSKGGGLGTGFGQSMGENIFGTQMGNVLTKSTVVLAIVFLLTTTALALLHSGRQQAGTLFDDEPAAPPPVAAPAAPGGTAPADTGGGGFDFGTPGDAPAAEAAAPVQQPGTASQEPDMPAADPATVPPSPEGE